MQLQQVNKGILPLILILGLFKITGLEAVENQKGKQDTSNDYDDDLSIEPEVPASPASSEYPYFEPKETIAYATREGENVIIKCQPKRFNEEKHEILWYRNDLPITTGNITLVVGDFVLDTKYRLIVLNYNQSIPYNFSCGVEPGHARQNVTIVFNPPDNMSEHNGAANIINNFGSIFQVAAMTLILVMTANAWN